MDFETFIQEAQLVKFPAFMTIDELVDEEMGYVVAPEYLQEVMRSNPDFFVYTLVEGDEIVPGYAFVNRIGYLFGRRQVTAETIRFE